MNFNNDNDSNDMNNKYDDNKNQQHHGTNPKNSIIIDIYINHNEKNTLRQLLSLFNTNNNNSDHQSSSSLHNNINDNDTNHNQSIMMTNDQLWNQYMNDILFDLAKICVIINDSIQQKTIQRHTTKRRQPENGTHDENHNDENENDYYPWFHGGDGPVFGIHYSNINDTNNNNNSTVENNCDNNNIVKSNYNYNSNIPHLRCYYTYDINVQDEWYLIHWLSTKLNINNYTLHMKCFDVDDGNIIFIHGSEILSNWIDEVDCTNRCWIIINPPIQQQNHYQKQDLKNNNIIHEKNKDQIKSTTNGTNSLIALLPPLSKKTTSKSHDNDESSSMLSILQALQRLVMNHNYKVNEALNHLIFYEMIHNDMNNTITNNSSNDSGVDTDLSSDPQIKQQNHKKATSAATTMIRTIIYIPKFLSLLLHKRYDLLSVAIQFFYHYANQSPFVLVEEKEIEEQQHETWQQQHKNDKRKEDSVVSSKPSTESSSTESKSTINLNNNNNNNNKINKNANGNTTKCNKDNKKMIRKSLLFSLMVENHKNNINHNDNQSWIYMIITLSKVQYALLRNYISYPYWLSEDTIPSQYMNEQWKLHHEITVSTSSHLQYAMQLGIRILAGFDYMLQNSNSIQYHNNNPSASITERRVVQYWSKIEQAVCCYNNGVDNNNIYNQNNIRVHDTHSHSTSTISTIQQSWFDGPKISKHNLEYIMKCPVYQYELNNNNNNNNPCPLSYPDQNLYDQIKMILMPLSSLVDNEDDDNDDNDDSLPQLHDVDAEDWMYCLSITNDSINQNESSIPGTDKECEQQQQQQQQQQSVQDPQSNINNMSNHHQLNDILGSVQTFFNTKSDLIDGVEISTLRNNNINNNSSNNSQTGKNNQSGTESLDHKKEDEKMKTAKTNNNNDRCINPTVFMNLLHTVLKAKDGITLKNDIQLSLNNVKNSTRNSKTTSKEDFMYDNDPYFTRDDYEALDPSADDDDDDSENNADDDDINNNSNNNRYDNGMDENDYYDSDFDNETIQAIMKQMDEELAQNQNLSRSMDNDDHCTGEKGNGNQVSSDDIHLLSNLLKSMNASNGLPGPVHSLLTEAGILKNDWIHQFPSDLDDDNNDDDDDDDNSY